MRATRSAGAGRAACLGLYRRLLGARWHTLDEAVRRAHADGADVRATGSFRICHGRGRLSRLLIRAARLPRPSDAVETRLRVRRRGPIERWQRSFGPQPLVSVQAASGAGQLAERFGVLEFRFRLAVQDGALIYRQVGLTLRLDPFQLPVPRWLAPRIAARESAAQGPDQTCVAVEVTGPGGGLLFSYRGTMRWEEVAG